MIHEMKFIGHTFTLFVLLMLSGELATIAGESKKLGLPGSSLATFTPLFVLIFYLIGGVMPRTSGITKWSGRVAQILVVLVMFYPGFIYNHFSLRIEVKGTISSFETEKFRKEFQVPFVMEGRGGSFCVVVPRNLYEPRMESFLKDLAATPTTHVKASN